MAINHASISGNLTRDPELRRSQSGGQALSFTVAVNESRKNPATGEYEERANYIQCVVFGNRAAALESKLSKGTKVAIDGRLRWDSWMQDDVKRERIEIVVNEIEFLSRKQAAGPSEGSELPAAPELADEDIAF